MNCKISQYIESFLGTSDTNNQKDVDVISNFNDLLQYIETKSVAHQNELNKDSNLKNIDIGFSFCLQNNKSELYQIGISKSGWLIIRIKPEPTKIYKSKNKQTNDDLVAFYLPGWRDIPKHDLLPENEAKPILEHITQS